MFVHTQITARGLVVTPAALITPRGAYCYVKTLLKQQTLFSSARFKNEFINDKLSSVNVVLNCLPGRKNNDNRLNWKRRRRNRKPRVTHPLNPIALVQREGAKSTSGRRT